MQMGLWEAEAVNPAGAPAEQRDLSASAGGNAQPVREELWETVFSRENLKRALKRVERNRGAAGVDGMTVAELRPWLRENWVAIRKQLDEGTYRPAPVRRVTIPKPDGGERMLGVPTVVDRLIQQAIAQALTPIFDPGFSEHSYGFRPGRSAHQAVRAAKGYVVEGYQWVVDVDLDRFFDRVQHDVLMARVARKVGDRRLLRLIRRYLSAGIMVDGVKQASAEGTPQGSPLSPLLANIMLDDLDRELEGRGHRFVRYADDLRVYVRSERAAQRTLESVTGYLERRLRLKVNGEKSSARHAAAAVLLGFGFVLIPSGAVLIRVDPKAVRRMRLRLRTLTGRVRGISMERRIGELNRYITGWCAYFALAASYDAFRKVEGWLRRRLRQVRWVEWKRVRARIRALRALGIPPVEAIRHGNSRLGSWRLAASPTLSRALPNSYWTNLGLVGFLATYRRLRPS
jgi:group II intron reverse transcriptase/maturase